MRIEKKFGKFALRFLAVAHLFIAAACWRMNGIYTERIYGYGDAETMQFIALGYAFVAAGALLSSLVIMLSLRLMRTKGKHAA